MDKKWERIENTVEGENGDVTIKGDVEETMEAQIEMDVGINV